MNTFYARCSLQISVISNSVTSGIQDENSPRSKSMDSGLYRGKRPQIGGSSNTLDIAYVTGKSA